MLEYPNNILTAIGLIFLIILKVMCQDADNKPILPLKAPEIEYKYQIQLPPYFCNGPLTNCYWKEYTENGTSELHWIDEEGKERITAAKYVIDDFKELKEKNLWHYAK